MLAHIQHRYEHVDAEGVGQCCRERSLKAEIGSDCHLDGGERDRHRHRSEYRLCLVKAAVGPEPSITDFARRLTTSGFERPILLERDTAGTEAHRRDENAKGV